VIEVRAPKPETIHNAEDLRIALAHAAPTIAAFILSFIIIFITWVNHHALIRSIPRTSAAFLFANGFLLLTVAFIPFPTALLGEFILSKSAAPAVVFYNAVLAAQALAWVLLTRSALVGALAGDAAARVSLRLREQSGYAAMVLYSVLAIVAMWLPVPAAVLTTATWGVWLVMSLRAKHA
jgi:uncharacterized membrane protein